ncbi:MAG: MarC family protein [Halobacteriota archaeon]
MASSAFCHHSCCAPNRRRGPSLQIGLEMVYARTSFTKRPSLKHAEAYAEDIAVTPLAIPNIAGPGAIMTVIALIGDAAGQS